MRATFGLPATHGLFHLAKRVVRRVAPILANAITLVRKEGQTLEVHTKPQIEGLLLLTAGNA